MHPDIIDYFLVNTHIWRKIINHYLLRMDKKFNQGKKGKENIRTYKPKERVCREIYHRILYEHNETLKKNYDSEQRWKFLKKSMVITVYTCVSFKRTGWKKYVTKKN